MPIGEEVSERYGYIPSCVEVIEDVRVKYACNRCQEHVIVAAVPSKPIPKGLADSSMLAYIATSKFADHLPLNRLEGIFKRHGAEISRSTMCDWMAFTANLLMPIYEEMKSRVLNSHVIWTDDTPVDLQDREHENNIRQARIWAYLATLTTIWSYMISLILAEETVPQVSFRISTDFYRQMRTPDMTEFTRVSQCAKSHAGLMRGENFLKRCLATRLHRARRLDAYKFSTESKKDLQNASQTGAKQFDRVDRKRY